MIRKLPSISWKHTSMALLLSSSLVVMPPLPPAAHAASEGVYISSQSYFTLAQAVLSSTSLQFSVILHNRESRVMDFNAYGVRVTDHSGRSYTARLSEKKSAIVLPGQEQRFRFYSDINSGTTAEQLQVEIFRWDSSQADFMKHMGMFSVASVAQEGQASISEEIMNLHTVDNTLANDASITYQLGQSVRVVEEGKWYLYTQLSVKNLGAGSVKLPAALQVRLKEAGGLKYASAITDGKDQTFLPNQSDSITLKTAISKDLSEHDLGLEFYYMNQIQEVSLSSMDISSSLQTVTLGDTLDYMRQLEGEHLTVQAEKATYSNQADGVHVQTVVTLRNEGDSMASLPSLLASYQFGGSRASITSTDHTSRLSYLSPKETASFYFNAVLPEGIDPNTVQLVLWEKTTGSSANSSASGTSSSGVSGTTTSNGTPSSASAATADSTAQVPVTVFLLKGASEARSAFLSAPAYTLGEKLMLSSSGVVDKNLDVSLVELHTHVNEDFGYQTAIGKYKITNKGTSTIALPELQNELIDSQGKSYTGSRQSSVPELIMPGTSYVISYSYLLPSSLEEDRFALNVYDDQAVSQGKVSLGAYQVGIQEESDSDTISFYPFLVQFKDFALGWSYSSGSYTYYLNLTMAIDRPDPVIVDSNFSRVQFELVDALDRIIGMKTMTFTGTDKLINGKQKITFSGLSDEQGSSGNRVKIYEIVETANGTAKRLVKELKY
ncbi:MULTISPECIES: hypothetical protein [unclassified Paenibacillus]|uniref:hypothetical protein n=1 Tax=unclassified Paenibacillus TaxID=185978 RepID=UPI001AEA98EC|nr:MULTISPECIES: hypothetical protein [unclassified Paenibacillus]MBP1157387.1 hypothetical protein [Paenibacillus sp. PvP091]MBP1171875.1 hypothetical protein [Paenibacillus sp. PvR098]MBP2438256.1 hypothetical protein [Paenibacillus sp. PvP052]